MENIQFYFEGDDYFRAIHEAILAARKSVDVEIYYLASDPVGRGLVDRLILKAKEGVSVRLIYDAIGCRNTSTDLMDRLKAGGVQIKKYNAILPPGPGKKFFRRDHRKMVVVDEKIGFIGGFNFAAEYSRASSGEKAWRDTGVRLTDSSLVLRLAFLFNHSWKARLLKARDLIKNRRKRFFLTSGPFYILANYGWRQKSLIREEYLSAIARAKKRVYLTTPYFVPDRGIRSALKRAAKRGIDVRLLVPGICDLPVVAWAAQSTYASFLKAGVQIYEYQNRVLHAKSAIVDDHWFTVGTANLDEMSFFSNLEVNLFGKDAVHTLILADQFQKDLLASKLLETETWAARSWMARLREKISFYFRVWL